MDALSAVSELLATELYVVGSTGKQIGLVLTVVHTKSASPH